MHRSLFRALFNLHFITPLGLIRWAYCLVSEGVTLMAALKFSARYFPTKCAVVSERLVMNYSELYQYACRLAYLMYSDYNLRQGDTVAMFCRNHTVSLLLLPALSRLGVNVLLLNTDLGTEKIEELLNRNSCKLLVYDKERKDGRSTITSPYPAIDTDILYEKLFAKNEDNVFYLPPIFHGPAITVMTGGTSGHYTEATRHPSVTQFLPPFFALLRDVGIGDYNSVFLALPFYHGFGLATLIVSLLMGKKICLMRHFDASQALKIIRNEEIEVLPLVPVMLARMWQQEGAKEKMKSLRCILCGGDHLDRKLVETTHSQLGNVLYNLYGTSEAGFFLLATPDDLSRHSETTLGKPIRGVKCKVVEKDAEGVGTLWVRSGWAMTGRNDQWQSTGDLVMQDTEGYYFHRGRRDGLVVCGGENVWPDNVMRALSLHPAVVASHVYAVPHPEFGNVLNARIELRKDSTLSSEDVKQWLAPRISRAEMPHEIFFGPIETLSTGKIKSQ
ncbi:MAG: AMP-binding protein [Bacteroidales bacterium]|nr:AMP-binding protein [Bacteroidales bacterium]